MEILRVEPLTIQFAVAIVLITIAIIGFGMVVSDSIKRCKNGKKEGSKVEVVLSIIPLVFTLSLLFFAIVNGPTYRFIVDIKNKEGLEELYEEGFEIVDYEDGNFIIEEN